MLIKIFTPIVTLIKVDWLYWNHKSLEKNDLNYLITNLPKPFQFVRSYH